MLEAVAVPPARRCSLLLSKPEPRDFNELILIALTLARVRARTRDGVTIGNITAV